MAKGRWNMLMELIIKEIGKMICNMGMELLQAPKETNIKDNIKKVFKKVKDNLSRLMVNATMDFGKMDILMVRENQSLVNKHSKVNS